MGIYTMYRGDFLISKIHGVLTMEVQDIAIFMLVTQNWTTGMQKITNILNLTNKMLEIKKSTHRFNTCFKASIPQKILIYSIQIFHSIL
jgi:hypothetical protein